MRIGIAKPQVTNKPPPIELSLVKRVLLRLIKALYFIYSVFIGSQLLFLAYSELKRLKSLASFIINNSKMIRIKDSSSEERE